MSTRARILLPLACLSLTSQLALAGGYAAIEGHSMTYTVTFNDPTLDADSVITSYNTRDGMPGYSGKPTTVNFRKECRPIKGGFTCSPNGASALAGATYKRTDDASPPCPGHQNAHRYTCIRGCSVKAPRYLNITPFEC